MTAQADPITSRPNRRWPRRVLIIFLVLVGLYVAYRYTLHRIVEAKLDEIRSQGYPATLAELDKWYPRPLPGENAADMYLEAFKHFERPAETHSNLPVVGFAKTPKSGESISTGMKQGIADYLSGNRQALELLQTAAGKSACRYPVDLLDERVRLLTPMFSEVRQGARLLYLDTLVASVEGDSKRAADAILASIALAESMDDRALLTSYFVEKACLGLTISSLEQALTRTSLSDHQLLKLSEAFKNAETNDTFARAIVGERAWANDQWTQIRRGKVAVADLLRYGEDTKRKQDSAVTRFYCTAGLVDLDYIRELDFYASLIEVCRLRFPTRLERNDSLSRTIESWHFCPLARMQASLLCRAAVQDARFIAQLRAVCTSLAVERYRLANRDLPNSLNMLTPQFIDTVPTDPFDGQQMRYKKLTKGYVVYSIGEDRTDNGGNGTFKVGVGPIDITFTVER